MTRTVHRFEVPVDDCEHTIEMHPGQITRVEMGASVDVVEFWAEQDTSQKKVEGVFLVVGTGHRAPYPWVIAGTTARRDGLVWHLLAFWQPAAKASADA